ncbi:UNVERIFIED_CONTAM: hypothetical protein RMT77_003373 [Armadillidium vulgare]|nr:Meiotic nuclear division protein 1-like protein [Armadillidium vulgare]
MGRKGLSHEEKRQKVMEIFYEKKDFFQLKELERIAPKEKGVISQSVKDIVQSLVDDGLVDTDKIGTCIYFWAFPSKASITRTNKIEKLENSLKDVESKIEISKKEMENLKIGREDTSEREAILERLSEVQSERNDLESQLHKSEGCHPDLIKKYKEEAQIALDAANRWTDNIFAIKSWCKKKFFIEESTLNKQFNIPDDLDYL